MTTDNNTQIFNLINQIDECKNAFVGFSKSFTISDEIENSTINFIFNSQSKQLEAISKKLLSLISKKE